RLRETMSKVAKWGDSPAWCPRKAGMPIQYRVGLEVRRTNRGGGKGNRKVSEFVGDVGPKNRLSSNRMRDLPPPPGPHHSGPISFCFTSAGSAVASPPS